MLQAMVHALRRWGRGRSLRRLRSILRIAAVGHSGYTLLLLLRLRLPWYPEWCLRQRLRLLIPAIWLARERLIGGATDWKPTTRRRSTLRRVPQLHRRRRVAARWRAIGLHALRRVRGRVPRGRAVSRRRRCVVEALRRRPVGCRIGPRSRRRSTVLRGTLEERRRWPGRRAGCAAAGALCAAPDDAQEEGWRIADLRKAGTQLR